MLLGFPLPRAPWPQLTALPHTRTAGRFCSPHVVFPGISCTSLLFICVLQAPCASRPLVYTRNHQKSLPKDAASRQTPVASWPQQERGCGYQSEPHRLVLVTASRVTQHLPEPSLGFRCWVGHRDAVGMGVCQAGLLPIHLIPVGKSREASSERGGNSPLVSLLWARHLK